MGNDSEKAKADIKVILDKIMFLPGENITGKIYIFPKTNSEIEQLQNPDISLSIIQHKNWETLLFSEEYKSSINDQDTNLFQEKTNNYIEYKNIKLSKGVQIPINYVVPKDITPSLEWPHTRFEFAYIRNFFDVKIPELNYETQILIIIQKLPSALNIPLKVEKEVELKKMILFGAGKIKIEGTYPQSSYPIFGQIPLTVTIDASNSECLVKEVKVKLKRRIEFSYKKKNKTKKKLSELCIMRQEKLIQKKKNFCLVYLLKMETK